VISDNGNIIVLLSTNTFENKADCDFGVIRNVKDLSVQLDSIVGLVEHGLFYNMVDKIYFGNADGSVSIQ